MFSLAGRVATIEFRPVRFRPAPPKKMIDLKAYARHTRTIHLPTLRSELMARDPHCYYCKRECREYPELQNSLLKKGTTYPPDMATIEHLYDRLEPEKRYQIYPNNEDKVLACLECNHARAKKRLRALGRKEQTRRTLLGQERRVKGIKTPRLYYFKKQ